MSLIRRPCSCNGHSDCKTCGGSGISPNYSVQHPKCGKSGCKGTMFPVDQRPGARLKCDKCNYLFPQ